MIVSRRVRGHAEHVTRLLRSSLGERRGPEAPARRLAGPRVGHPPRWSSSGSRVNLRPVAQVEADRLHDLKRGAGCEDVCGRKNAGVLLDDRRRGGGCGGGHIVPHRGPGVLAVLDEIRSGIDGVQGLP